MKNKFIFLTKKSERTNFRFQNFDFACTWKFYDLLKIQLFFIMCSWNFCVVLFLFPFANGQLDSLPNGLEAIATDSDALRCASVNTGQCSEADRKVCGCSCNPTCKLKQKRLQDCCASIGMPDQCRNLCNYNPGKNVSQILGQSARI